MKGTLAVFGEVDGRGIAAYVKNGQVEDLLIDPPDDRMRPGAIYRAKAGRLLKGLGGAIMETPDGSVFLRNAKGVGQGETRLVQVVSFADQNKATPVTTRLVFKSRYCLATPGAPGLNLSRDIRNEERRVELRDALVDQSDPEIGLVIRSSAATADDDAVREDVEAQLALARTIMADGESGSPELLLDGPDAATLGWREWPAPDATETTQDAIEAYGLPEELERLRGPNEPLESGASMFVEPTRALVAVDVNTGGDTSPAASLKANLAAAAALPRALRLRGLGGQILVDFAPMPKKDRRQLESTLRRAFRDDPVESSLVGWTTLGLFEIQRKRERLPLSESLRDMTP